MQEQASPSGQSPSRGESEGVHPNDSKGETPQSANQALLGGVPHRVGQFEYRYDSDTWTWSDSVARMHGYEPGQVVPNTKLILSHKHPDDVAQVRSLLEQSAAPFSSRHRVYTTTGELREIVVVGDEVTDDDGRTVATRGFYVDVTDSEPPGLTPAAGEGPETTAQPDTVVEQAKGMLMMACQVDADTAFRMLRWRSHVANVELGWIAERVVADLPALVKEAFPDCPVVVNQYLSTLSEPL